MVDRLGRSVWQAGPVVVAAVVTIPLGLVLARLFMPTPAVWSHLWSTMLPEMLRNTLLLAVGVGVVTFGLGAGLALLVTFYEFPGRRLFDWALILPLAVPAYVLGFVFMATFDFAGPVQSTLRHWFGPGVPFPNIRSGGGAILVMGLTLYPYVYFLARAAFREQSASTFEAARAMGYTRGQTFLRLVLPLARPSLVAGVTLAVLEAMTDFATVRFYDFPTLSEGVVRVWQGLMDREAATELASLLLVFALLIVGLERRLRGRARYFQSGRRAQQVTAVGLSGMRRWGAVAVCGLVLGMAFILPALRLLGWVIGELRNGSTALAMQSVYAGYVLRTFGFAAAAAVVSVVLALFLAQAARAHPGKLVGTAIRFATLGYAVPGAVIAAGVLLTLSGVDRLLLGWTGAASPWLLGGSIVGLIYAYVVRFMAVAYNSVESSLVKVTPSMEMAARSLGASPSRVMWRVQMPLARIGLATGAALVLVDAMKELPATMLLIPFGRETLSLWTYMLAAESFWRAAALPALTIVAVGLLPVLLLMRVGGRSAPGVATGHAV